MKRLKLMISVGILTLVAAFALTACGDKDPVYDRSYVDGVLSKSAEPYLVSTSIKVGELESNSTMKIGMSNGVKIAEYSFSKQHYNEISIEQPPETQISTVTGIEYFNGTQVGKVVNGVVVWTDGSLPNQAPPQFDLSKIIADGYRITATDSSVLFEGMLLDNKCEEVLGIAGATNAAFSLKVDISSERITELQASYTKDGVNTTIKITYGYTLQTVTLP